MNVGNIVDTIRELCQKNNMTISQLERELYMSPGLISRWNKNTPSFDRIIEIANYFGVSLDILANNEHVRTSGNIIINRLLSILYHKSIGAELEWNVWDSENIPSELNNNYPSILEKPINIDAYYCEVNQGYFFVIAQYTESRDISLSLYVLADRNSKPELKCSETDKLLSLHSYLDRRFSKQLNSIKTNNFIENFINTNINQGNDKITQFKQA